MKIVPFDTDLQNVPSFGIIPVFKESNFKSSLYHFFVDDALQKLAIFESKYSRLKDERDNVAKAKEALELQDVSVNVVS